MSSKPFPCPYCSFPMECDTVNVGGPGWDVQCGPYCCDECGASEIGPERIKYQDGYQNHHDKMIPESNEETMARLNITEEEFKTGFYRNRISPLANQHNGKVISHRQADALYRKAYFEENGNPNNAPIIR